MKKKRKKMREYQEFLYRYAANAERLHRIGIHPFGYDPGYLCSVEGGHNVELPEKIIEIICDLIKKVYPETSNDAEMIQYYKERNRSIG